MTLQYKEIVHLNLTII